MSGALSGAATAWADGLAGEGATVLAGYEHPHHGEFAAETTNAHGRGRVTHAVIGAGAALELGPWDVRLLVEEP